ncbi:MAG: hypothetical protein ABSA79_04230 [Candidatus Bathyarchaeia archaeon]|jgi:hypothetical protein
MFYFSFFSSPLTPFFNPEPIPFATPNPFLRPFPTTSPDFSAVFSTLPSLQPFPKLFTSNTGKFPAELNFGLFSIYVIAKRILNHSNMPMITACFNTSYQLKPFSCTCFHE